MISWSFGKTQTEKLKDDLNNIYKPGVVEEIKEFSHSDMWAIVNFIIKDEKFEKKNIIALLKMDNEKWTLVTGTSNNATTDFLKYHKVPSEEWSKLIDKNRIEATKPLLDFLHKKKAGYYFEYVTQAENWAIVSWKEIKSEIEGNTILKKDNGRWNIIEFNGDVMTKESLKKYGMPENIIKKFEE